MLRVAGNRKLYLKLLRQFSIEQANAPAEIAALLAAGDTAAAERAAHTVRGVAANLGADAVRAAAGELEKTLSQAGEPAQLESLRQKLAAVLTPFVARLSAALGDEPSSPAPPATAAVDPAEMQPVIAQMTKYLDEFDAAAADCLQDHRGVFSAIFPGDEFARFEQHLANYAFGEALAQLQQRMPAGEQRT